MAQKELKILGKKVPVVFNMATQIAFEENTDKAFDLALLTHAKARLALYYAAIVSADKETSITVDDLMTADFNDINALDKTLYELITEFYHLGNIEEAHVTVSDSSEEDNSKN